MLKGEKVHFKAYKCLTPLNIVESVYDFLLSVCPCSKFSKYTSIDMKLIYIMEVCYGIFGIQNEECSILGSFTMSVKIIPLHYRLWGKMI